MAIISQSIWQHWRICFQYARLKPSSAANSRAVEAASASISMGVYCCGRSLDIEAMTKPLLSRITKPMPNFFCSLKVALLQFIFTTSGFGGRHLARIEVRSGRVMEDTGWVIANSATRSFADDRIWWTLMFG